MFKNKGFSLIELLLVVAIAAGIFAFSAPFGMNFYRTQLLGDVQSNLIDALQRARHNAVLQKNDSNFGVKLSDINNNYVLFQTPDLTYSNRVQSQDEVFTVARGITLTTGLSDVIFSKMTGLPNATGTINIFYNSDLYRGILVDNNAVLSKIDATSSAPVVVGSNETTVPDAPTISTATAGNTTATVTFTAPAFSGGTAITGYTVTSNPAGGIDTNAGSTGLSHSITGLTNSTVYTFTVTATNNVGTSLASGSSNSVTPLPTDVYWVGGTGNWSDSANHWASTSGGTANANNLPGVTTNVTFDTNSGTGIVTVNGNASMATFTHSKASLTVAIGTYNLAVTGASSLTNGTTTIGISAGTGWTTGNLTVGANGTVAATGNAKVTISGNFDQSSITSKFLASTATITVNGNGTFTADGTVDSTQYNSASLVLNGVNTLTYNNKSNLVYGFNHLTTGQGGLTTTLSTTMGIQGVLIVGSGQLTISSHIWLSGANPLSFNSSSIVSGGTIFFLSSNQTIPALANGYDSNIRLDQTSGTVTQTGDVVLNSNKTLIIDGYGDGSRVETWKTDGYNLTVGGGLQIGYGADTGLKKLDATRNGARTSTITVGGNWTNYGTGSAPSQFVADNSTVILNSTATGKTITSGSTIIPNAFNNLTFNGTGGGWTLQDNATVAGNLTVSAGTLAIATKDLTVTGSSTVTGGTATIGISSNTGWTTAGMTIGTGGTVTATGASIITASGNWNSSAGTFNYGASTVNLTGTGSVTTVGWAAIAFYKLSVAYTGYTTTFSTSNMSVKQIIVNGGTLTGAGAVLRLDPTLSTTGLVSNNSSSTINLSLDYNPTTANTTYYIGADAVMTGTSISLSCNPDNVNFELNRNLSIQYLTIENHGSGTTFSTGANSYSLTLSNDFTDTHYGYVPNNTSFSVYFNNSSVTIGGNLTPMQYAGIAAYNKTDYFYFGGANISIKGNYTTYYTYGGNTYSWVINPGTSTVNFTKTSGTQTVTSFNGTSTQPFYNLTKSGAGTLTLADNLVASGNILHTAGTLNAGGKNITTTGNLTISDGALVTASGLAGSTVTAGGNFSASGHAGALLTLNPASAWYLKVAGTAVANYVNVAYSNAGGGTAITQTNSTNGGNNTNWGF
jgi:prepilin-type N-terminal cleavage/methylation domain-containing protein